jgi:hypothetical protein
MKRIHDAPLTSVRCTRLDGGMSPSGDSTKHAAESKSPPVHAPRAMSWRALSLALADGPQIFDRAKAKSPLSSTERAYAE